MNEEFDKRLTDRIKEVFDNAGDNSANDGWLLLREKYPTKNERRPIAWLWWGMAAAVLLLSVATVVWFSQPQKNDQNTIVRAKTNPAKVKPADTAQQIAHNKTAKSSRVLPGDKVNSATANIGRGNTSIVAANKMRSAATVKKLSEQQFAGVGHNVKAHPLKNVANTQILKQPQVKQNGATNGYDGVGIAAVSPSAVKASQSPNTSIIDSGVIPKAIKPVTGTPVATNVDTTTSKPAAAAKAAPRKKDEPVKSFAAATGTPRVVFGIYASAFQNYLIGNGNSYFNLGIGGTADILLSDNFKLSTGLSILQNSFSYNTIPTTNLVQSNSFSSPVSSGLIVSTFYLVSVRTIWNTKILALDIPVNLKYQFGRHKAYISSGFSSGMFLSEQYAFSTTYTPQTATLQDNTTTTQKYLNSFYFFKTFNLAFGLGHQLTQNGSLYIEPFAKIPLSGAGYQNLRFGSIGINLKFNFETSKP